MFDHLLAVKSMKSKPGPSNSYLVVHWLVWYVIHAVAFCFRIPRVILFYRLLTTMCRLRIAKRRLDF